MSNETMIPVVLANGAEAEVKAAPAAAMKLYAAQVRNVSLFETNASILIQVYGRYNPDNPKELQQFTKPVMSTISLGLANPKLGIFHKGSRVVIPAVGLSAEPTKKPLEDKRTGEAIQIHPLLGVDLANAEQLNARALMDEQLSGDVKEARVMEGASESLLAKLVRIGKGLVIKQAVKA
jgi:hypothetical protein